MLEDTILIPDSLSEAQMLLPGGPFEHFSGSLVVVGPNRTVLYCNEAGRDLAAHLQSQTSPQLRNAVEGAFVGRPAQFTPFKPNGQQHPGSLLDLAVLPWDNGAAVVLLGRDVTFERAQRSALRSELTRARHKDNFHETLTDLLTKGLDLDLLADVMLRGLVQSLSLAGAQLLSISETARIEILAKSGEPVPANLQQNLHAQLIDKTSVSLEQEDSHLLALRLKKGANEGAQELALVIWKQEGKAFDQTNELDLLKSCLKRLLAI